MRNPWIRMGIAVAGPIAIVLIVMLVRNWLAPDPASRTLGREDFELLPQGTAFHDKPGDLIAASALIAFLTCALVQILKERSGMRAHAHHEALITWVDARLDLPHLNAGSLRHDHAYWEAPQDFKPSEDGPPFPIFSSKPVDRTIHELEDLAAGGVNDFYDLSTAQFCGQIGSAIDLMMIEPRSSPHLVSLFLAGARRDHWETVTHFLQIQSEMEKEASKRREQRQSAKKGADKSKNEDVSDETLDIKDKLRVRLHNYAQRALDSLQLQAARKWRQRLMSTTFQVSCGVALAVVLLISRSVENIVLFFYSTLLCAVAGGLLAPLIYDLLSAVKALGQR